MGVVGRRRWWSGLLCVVGLLLGGVVASPVVEAVTWPVVGQVGLVGPAGSESFGSKVVVLSNGNYVVVDDRWDDGGTVDVGAVYLYDGATNTVISTLTGSMPLDRVGLGGVVALSNGNFVVLSPVWDDGGTGDVGAVTWGDGTAGVTGLVSSSNSLHGSAALDTVGSAGVVALSNGNYVMLSPNWDDGGTSDVGAVTWGDGSAGVTGPVSSSNSCTAPLPWTRLVRLVWWRCRTATMWYQVRLGTMVARSMWVR